MLPIANGSVLEQVQEETKVESNPRSPGKTAVKMEVKTTGKVR